MRFDDFDALAPLTALAGLMVLALLPTPGSELEDAALLRPYDVVLEHGAVGTRVAWRNPASGRPGTLTAEQPFVGTDGAWCRVLRIADLREPGATRRAVCRGADGGWRFAEPTPEQMAETPADASAGLR